MTDTNPFESRMLAMLDRSHEATGSHRAPPPSLQGEHRVLEQLVLGPGRGLRLPR
jgi:hypothetical protein